MMLNPSTPSCWRRLVLIAHTVGLLAMAVPVGYAMRAIDRIDAAFVTVSRLHDEADAARRIADHVAAGAVALSAMAHNLERGEREQVLHATDRHFESLGLAREHLALLARTGDDLGERQAALARLLDLVLTSWGEMRDLPDPGGVTADQTFHLLQMFDAMRRVQHVLDGIERHYEAALRSTNSAARADLARALLVLAVVVLLAAGINAAVALWNNSLLRCTQQAHDEITGKEIALREQHGRFAAALAHMPHGLIMLDRDLNLVVCNARYAAFYGLAAEACRAGTPLAVINRYRAAAIVDGDEAGAETNLDAVRAQFRPGAPVHSTARLKTGRIIAIRRQEIASGGWIAIHEDVTEVHLAEAARNRALEEAEQGRLKERAAIEASRAKSGFLATMSHEIRTPMNALLGLSSTLLESRLDDEQRRAVEAIHDSSDNLLRILNDILDFSKLESGKLDLEQIVFSPAALCDNVVSIMAHRAAGKGIRLRVEAESALPPALIGDAGRLRQVLLNLVSNAIKFTAEGEVVLAARCRARTAMTAEIEYRVTDSGIGIPPERLEKLFDDYVQADTSIARRFGGTGLGLAISRRIVQQMGGTIGAQSQPGEGASFHVTVTLPLATEVDLAEPGARSPAEDLHAAIVALGRPLQVLLAEDNATNQYVVAQMLKGFDIRLTIAADGRKALESAQGFAFDLVLMDMRMPEMDGFEATRAIRALPAPHGRVPIVALTANAFADDVARCFAAGMTDFLAKPVRKPALVAAIVRLVPTSEAGRRATKRGATAPAPDAAGPVFDSAAYDGLAEEIGRDGVQATLRVFLDETQARLARLSALSCDGDRGAIRTEAHTLKGASATFGLCELAGAARSLEQAAADITADRYRQTVAALHAAFARARDALPPTDARAA